MQRINNLYHQIADYDNLLLAFWKASKGKRRKADVRGFQSNLHVEIQKLRAGLLNETIEVGDYHYFKVYDPKERTICAASFPERVLHHAIINICEPYFESFQIHDSYACRKEKGSLKAVKRAKEFSTKNDAYLKLDIAKYFDSIDHEVLISLLHRRFRDKRLLWLFEKIIASYETSPGKGVPIGNLTSQHFANFYLGVLDHHLKDDLGIKGYVRYMDDFIIFHPDKRRLRELLEEIDSFLAGKLKLRLNPKIYLNYTHQGINFLGYRVFDNTILLGQRSRNRFVSRLRKYEKRFVNGFWSENELVAHIQPLMAFTMNANALSFRQSILQRFGAVS